MARKLASIQKILNIEEIPGCDNIVLAQILGWHVIVMKKDFKVGDLCVYCEIDSIMPERPEFEFLRGKKFRIKTMKMHGVISQGIAFKLSDVLPKKGKYNEDDDVTEILGVTQHDPDAEVEVSPIPKYVPRKGWIRNKYCHAKWLFKMYIWEKLFPSPKNGPWPSFLTKTDETRVQVLQRGLTLHKDLICYITEKLEGSSTTYYLYKNRFGVCSRNLDLNEELEDVRWTYARANNIEEKLRKFANGRNIAIQGELVGPGVQGNIYKLEDKKVIFFSVYLIDEQRYANYLELGRLWHETNLELVPILKTDYVLTDNIDELVKLSEGYSQMRLQSEKVLREGIVIRTLDYNKFGRVFSCKVINPKYLLNQKD